MFQTIYGLKVYSETATGYIKSDNGFKIAVRIKWEFKKTEYNDYTVYNVKVTDVIEQDMMDGRWYELSDKDVDFEELAECIEIRAEELKREAMNERY